MEAEEECNREEVDGQLWFWIYVLFCLVGSRGIRLSCDPVVHRASTFGAKVGFLRRASG